MNEVQAALDVLERARTLQPIGRVTEVLGLVVRALVPGIQLGELVEIDREGESLLGEVVGFRGDEAVLMPLGDPRGIGPESAVRPSGRPLSIRVGEALLGRVLGGLGTPLLPRWN